MLLANVTQLSCAVSFKLTAQPEESVSKTLCESGKKEDEPQTVSLHPKQLGHEKATTEGGDVASAIEPSHSSLIEKESSKTSSNGQDNQNRKDVAEAADPSVRLEVSTVKDAKQHLELPKLKEGLISTSKSEEVVGEIEEVKPKHSSSDVIVHGNYPQQKPLNSSPKQDSELKVASDVFSEPGTGLKTYFETSSKSQKLELSQSQCRYEPDTGGEELHGDTKSIMHKFDDQHERKAGASPGKMSLEQRSLSLNITVGSGQIVTGANSKAFLETLCPISGSFDEPEIYPPTPSVVSQHQFPPAVSITPETSENIETKVETPLPSDRHKSSFEFSSDLSEMLDLAGTLPLPLSERREYDHMRRKSMPPNVSDLVGSSLAKLSLTDDASRVGQECQLEELGSCVFSDYAGPMPSPADVPSQHQHFPSVESEVVEEPRATETAQKVLQLHHKGVIPENHQKTMFEKKDTAVKTTLILEKAVPSGVKPDRLRIPVTSSKDRMTEFRLEIGLPDGLKIQAIPEVDIEKDPSREASPIPPDNSFTFTETEGKAPTTPKAPNDTPSEIVVEKPRKDFLPEDKAQNDNGNRKSELDTKTHDEPQQVSSQALESTEKDKKVQSENGTPRRLETMEKGDISKATADLSTEKTHIQVREVTVDKFSPNPYISSTVIIIPQAQVEEEADEDDIEIAEEPREMLEESEVSPTTEQAEVSLIKDVVKEEKKEQARLTVGDPVMEDEPKSGAEEWSHSANDGEEVEPAMDSSQLSPFSDRDQLVEDDRDEGNGEEKVAEVRQIDRDKCEKDCGGVLKEDQTGVREVAQVVPEQKRVDKNEVEDKDIEIGQEVEEATMDVSFIDTDSGWMDSQGTHNL